MRVAPAIKLNDEERKRLQTIARSPRRQLRLVQRAKIVLLADQGLENIEIAERVNVSMGLVGRWRRRYAESSFSGIEKDKTRPPGKAKTSPGIVQTILDKTMQETPPAQTHWSQHSIAEAVGVSPSTVGRVWRAHGLKPHLIKRFRSTGSIVALTGVRKSKKTARRSTVSVIVRWLDLAHGTVVAGATYPVSIRFTYHSTSRSRAVEGVNSGRFTPSTAYVATASSCKRSTIDPEDPKI
jgi:transposase